MSPHDVARCLQANSTLKILILGGSFHGSDIRDAGAVALAEALKVLAWHPRKGLVSTI